MRRYFLLLACSSLVTLAVSAEAQQGGSSIRGRIVDQQGAVLPGAAVTVTHQESGIFRETVTGVDGKFFVTGIVPGPYQVSAALEGFRKLARDVQLEVGATLTVDLALEVGALTETVTVTSEAPQVDLTSPQVGGNVSSAEITDLPSLTRNFTGLVALLPGVVYNPAADGNSDSVTINGQHGSGVVFLMDGGSNNDDLRGGSSGAQARTPLEAIQEFQVVTNQFDAEYGAAVAGVVNAVTKQGSNALPRQRHRVLHGHIDDGGRTSSSSSRTWRSRDTQEAAVGRHHRRADRPRQDALLLQLRAARTGGKAGAASTRRGRIGALLSPQEIELTGTTWAASITS